MQKTNFFKSRSVEIVKKLMVCHLESAFIAEKRPKNKPAVLNTIKMACKRKNMVTLKNAN